MDCNVSDQSKAGYIWCKVAEQHLQQTERRRGRRRRSLPLKKQPSPHISNTTSNQYRTERISMSIAPPRCKQRLKMQTTKMCHKPQPEATLFVPVFCYLIHTLVIIATVSGSGDFAEPDFALPFFNPIRTQPIKRSNIDYYQQNVGYGGQNVANSQQQQVSGQPVAAATSDQQQNQESGKRDSKFMPLNELDTFLDDMNQNELKNIASGRPIGDLFQPKPISAPSTTNTTSSLTDPDVTSDKKRRQNPAADLSEAVSQNQQQIYSECALILQRTYVKNINDPKHQLVPFGKTEQACISYKHIDKAFQRAKHELKFKDLTKRRKKLNGQPPLDVIHSTLEPPEDLIAALGELNMATTQILADQFDLSNDELLNGLPLIDMSKTKFWPVCPLLVRQDIKCEISRYRTFTGHCNNLKHPTWGAAMTPFARYLPPVHPDGIWIPRKSIVTEVTFELTANGQHEPHASVHSPSMPHPIFMESEPDLDQTHRELHRRNHLQEFEANQLDAAASVQFARHVDHHRYGHSAPAPHFAFGAQESHLMHYQQSHSPARPFAATMSPLIPMATPVPAASVAVGHRSKSLAHELPSARLVTSTVHRDVDLPNHDFTILFMSWGQLLDHDMTRAAMPPSSIKCCGDTGGPKHKLCLPISVPRDDPLYAPFNVDCLEFRRSLAGLRPNCVLGPRVHQNAITAPIDANFVYGSSQAQSDGLRLFQAGRLRDRDWFKREGLKPILPGQEIEPDLECIARPKNLFCFLAGDVRVNEQTHLTVLHTLYMREHNRLADGLGKLNPHWDDERLFQETRHIIAASVQHVMLNEYIPLLIGTKMAQLYNLTSIAGGSASDHLQAHWHGYDPSVTTSVSNSFAAAAFRQGHTFVQGTIERFNKFHEFVSGQRLRHLFKQPFLLYEPGVIDEITAGMVNQRSQSYDPFISEDISGHLFQPPDSQIGHDLPAINLQRGRDQGLPGYNLWREWCGLPRAETFDQLEPYLTNHTAFYYSRLYKHVDDIDLWSGGVSERKLPGAAIGPTFACIIARQFSNTRRGDRFWYENAGFPSSFTPGQLAEIRKITLAKILCANSDDLPTIQRWALRTAHPVLNPRVPCHHLPELDLRFWKEE